MAKKISAIVIPAVIDTTGIDKGINSIKTKLSGVRGSIGTRNSGTGGVGGGGNFGSGLPHYGGSAVGIGAAAAVGAGLGRGGGGGGGAPKSAFRSRVERASEWGEGAVKHIESFQNAQSNRLSKFMWNAGSKVKAAARYSQSRLDDEGVPPGTSNFQMRTNNIRRMNSLGSGLQKFGGATGRAYSSSAKLAKSIKDYKFGASDSGGESMFSGKRLATGAITATIAGAAYLRNNFTQGGIKSNFSDLSNLEGSPGLYNRAAAIKRRTYGPTGMPTFSQAMILGSDLQSENTTGTRNAEGVASSTDRVIAGVGVVVGKRVEFISSILTGDAFKGNNFIKGLKSVFN